MRFKGILFDMDGVIVDTEPLHRKAYFKMFQEMGISVSEEMYATFTGASTQKVCTRLIESFGLDCTWKELAEIKRQYFKHYFDNDPDFDLIPGVKNLIEHYRQEGLKLVLASSAHMNTINWVFEKFGLDKYFVGKISGADLKESKPHPEIFELAAKMSGEARENCMVIEDSTNGIQAANAAGIFVVAFTSPHTSQQDYSTADKIIHDYQEIYVKELQDW